MAMMQPEMEVCPNCGSYVDELNEEEGWCYDCAPARCKKCGGERTSTNKYCISCQRENWYERNAEQLEAYMAKGLTLSEAKSKIIRENRAICVVCSSEIHGKHKSNTLFCLKNKECRRARKKYFTFIAQGQSKEEALTEALRDFSGLS
jgi:hypothetical protein